MMSDKTYDTLKMVALLVLPVGTLVSSIMAEWGIPNAEHVMNTFKYLDVFVGAVVVIANKAYKRRQG